MLINFAMILEPALCQVVDLPSTLKVEIYPVEIYLCLHNDMDHGISNQFSRTDTIRESISSCMCRLFR